MENNGKSAGKRRYARLGLALALTVGVCTAYAIAGGAGYASSQAAHAVRSVKTVAVKAAGALSPSDKPKPPKPSTGGGDKPTSGKNQYSGGPPSIKKFSPKSGCAGEGVTISGDNLLVVTTVTIGGAGASFAVSSNNKIGATVPSAASTGAISVSGGNGTAVSGGTFTISGPKVSQTSPKKGPVGTYVVIGGNCFDGTTDVSFNGTPASFSVNSSGQILTSVPSGATTGKISVTTPNGSSLSKDKFKVTTP